MTTADGSLKLDNVWVFVQLIYMPKRIKNQLTKTQTLTNLRLTISCDYDTLPPLVDLRHLSLTLGES